MMIFVKQTGDWSGAKMKFKNITRELPKRMDEGLKLVTEEYKKDIQTAITRNNVEPEGGTPFTALQLAENVKIHPETASKKPGKAAFVGLAGDAPLEMQQFAVGAEYEKDAFVGIWRTVTLKYLAKLQKFAESVQTTITTFNRGK